MTIDDLLAKARQAAKELQRPSHAVLEAYLKGNASPEEKEHVETYMMLHPTYRESVEELRASFNS